MSDLKFQREFSQNKVDALTKTTLFKDKLRDDISKGKIFPAIRNGVIHFYYMGGRIFEFSKKYRTNIKYGFVPTSTKSYIDESDLESIKITGNFTDGFNKIKDRCAAYSRVEALGVSALYKDSAWCKKCSQGDIVLLDIEAMFSNSVAEVDSEIESVGDKMGRRYNHDRFDIVLYNSKSREIRIFEAKHFSNSELWSTNDPRVIKQIEQYEKVILNRETEIIKAYTRHINIMNNIFDKKYEAPATVYKKVGLLVFGFDANQVTKIKCQYNNRNTSLYIIGDVKNIRAKTLYESIDK